MLWGVSPNGECSCPLGSTRRQVRSGQSTVITQDCGGTGAGKHPWMDGDRGYVHGVENADASQDEAIAKWGPVNGSRRWGVTLSDTIVLDLDSPVAELAFTRLAKHLPLEKIMGVARTPRGWHIYVDAPGWNQRALNVYMKRWLEDWHGTDANKITRRGLLLDVRTGANRYVVWPEGSGEANRRWASAGEVRDMVSYRRYGMRPSRLISDGAAAPWNLPMTSELAAEIERIGSYTPRPDGITPSGKVQGGMDYAAKELTRWCGKLAAMRPDSGRNNMLNQIAFYAGTRAIAAGMPENKVRGALEKAALTCGMRESEIAATISSGLSSGLATVTR